MVAWLKLQQRLSPLPSVTNKNQTVSKKMETEHLSSLNEFFAAGGLEVPFFENVAVKGEIMIHATRLD